MSKRLQITLTEEATALYLEHASAKTEAEMDADVEPSGASIQVDIWHLMNEVLMEHGSGNWISIGEAKVEVLE